ncbi:enoyl-CoA hydratase/isomerase family protein [Pseudomonas graminis]|uniref:enoyl-CoA hydratase/isomerase family protein n=1 Tax=Pseudomonas graminis TaxID=158627 RepID=UPI003C26F18B
MSNVRYEVNGNIAEIYLDRHPVNALHEVMLNELLHALHKAAVDIDIRAVIIASAIPGRFCAGLDLVTLQSTGPEQLHDLLEKLYIKMFDAHIALGKPSIAAVGGAVRGGGMTVAVGCDMIVAGLSATFGYPEIDKGLLPAIHYAHLPRIIGRHRAFDLLFTGRTFGIDEALELGLINRAVPDTDILEEARKLASTFASKPALAVRRGRAAFMSAIDGDYRRTVASAVEHFCNTAATEEARELIGRFGSKASRS